VLRYQPNGTRAQAVVRASHAAQAIDWAQTLRSAHVIGEYSLTPVSLEDIYVDLVSGRPDDATGETPSPSTEEVAHARAA
jgi:ABC-2 type transport system ATP-binding protein